MKVITPHPAPLPMGEGTPAQRAQQDSLSHRERAGVRGGNPSFKPRPFHPTTTGEI